MTAAIVLSVLVSFLSRSRRAQAFSFLSLGVVMTMVWLRLGSLDVALAEAALGTGLLSALIVWLAVFHPAPHQPGGDDRAPAGIPTWLSAMVGILVGALSTLILAAAWLRVEDRLPNWEQPLAERLPETGVEHEVTGVLLAFRAYDTLLESAVLMLAGVAVLALGRGDGLAQTADPTPAMAPTLRWLVRVSAPALLLFGLWLLFAGSTSSGGAFQSGAILAGLLILLRVSQVELRSFNRRWLPPILILGVLVFLLFALIGPVLGAEWFSVGFDWSFAAILTVEVFLTAGIAVGLYLLYLGLESPVREDREVLS